MTGWIAERVSRGGPSWRNGQRSFVDAQGIDAAAVTEGRYAYFIDRAYRINDQDWGVFSLERLARTPEFRQAAA